MPSQFCLSLGFIGNQLCPDLKEGEGEGRIRDGSRWGKWCFVQEMEIGPSVTGSSPFALLPEILPLLTKGLGTQ